MTFMLQGVLPLGPGGYRNAEHGYGKVLHGYAKVHHGARLCVTLPSLCRTFA